jgi:bifunctional DNA-binding transcriptional regulator/antitoxin component of YhaV-PrlF toxin-antitoxin module
MIRLQGKWLEELGFRVGDRVVVVTDEERIVITKEDDTSLRGLGGSF